jgi:hypothetical protein
VLEKFSLRTDTPKKFKYKRIRDYLVKRLEVEEEARILNPVEAVKDFELEVEFRSVDTIPATRLASSFQPATLRIQPKNEQPKTSQMQSLPGTAATRNEVNDLVNKMLQLKINKASLKQSLWAFQ